MADEELGLLRPAQSRARGQGVDGQRPACQTDIAGAFGRRAEPPVPGWWRFASHAFRARDRDQMC